MTSGQKPGGMSLDFDKTQFGIRVKCPKLVLFRALEVGVAATYSVAEPDDDDKTSIIGLDRLKPSLTVKDIFFRGKIELEPRKIHYSKKLRMPFTNTDLVKLRLTAQLPGPQTSGSLLGRALGLTISFTPQRLYARNLVRRPPNYALQMVNRIGPPQSMYDDIGFPGSVYFKTNSVLHLSDATAARAASARLEVRRMDVVMRLYDVGRVKPCRLGRNLAHVARRLTLEDAEAEDEERQVKTAVKVARVLEASQPEPDVIDKMAVKAREWAHAVLVNSCVATRHLQDRLQGVLGKAPGGAVATSS